jgi:ribonuclease BN (tRNA processing enzyme)
VNLIQSEALYKQRFFCILENPNIKEKPLFKQPAMHRYFRLLFLVCVFAACASAAAFTEQCPPATGVAVQVLGSGGPVADDGRASSAYLVWVDGKSRVLIDAGGGTFLRFAEAGANFHDLDFVGLSHFHTDHSADFPALLKSASFGHRERALIVTGPDGSELFPGLKQFLESLLGKNSGAFAYLSGYLDGGGGLPKLGAFEINSENTGPVTVLGDSETPLQIEALHVPHGIVPSLAFRIRSGDQVLVFGSDQNGDKHEFVDFARDADILVMHMAIPEGVRGVGRRLHAPPSVIGTIADDANAKILIISHLMARSIRDLDASLEILRSKFAGSIEVAEDLRCYKTNPQEY